MRRSVKFLSVWIGCAFCFAALTLGVQFGLNGAGRRVSLARSWKVTTGNVVAVDRNNHLSIAVRYSVEGRQVEQTFQGSEKGIGELVTVYYSPRDATLADIRNPASSLGDDLKLLSVGRVGFGLFLSIFSNFRVVDQTFAWPWLTFHPTPRFVMTYILVAVFIGTAANLVFQPHGWKVWLAGASVLGGTILMCVAAFRLAVEIPWKVYFKSRIFVYGVLLVLIGWGQWRG
jgi:hypothetical protein